MTHLRTDDVVDLTCDLIDIPSVSGDEKTIADAIEEALRGASHLEVLRDGDAIVARTNRGSSQRVIIAGHIVTVEAGVLLTCSAVWPEPCMLR